MILKVLLPNCVTETTSVASRNAKLVEYCLLNPCIFVFPGSSNLWPVLRVNLWKEVMIEIVDLSRSSLDAGSLIPSFRLAQVEICRRILQEHGVLTEKGRQRQIQECLLVVHISCTPCSSPEIFAFTDGQSLLDHFQTRSLLIIA